MLRLPTFQIARPKTLAAATALLAEHKGEALILAGGTDLVPNMKHELFTPKLVVALADIPALTGVRRDDDGTLVIGAMTTLDTLASDALVAEHAPALAQAASLISGPQLRRMGTLGGNVMLDTRCQWYNQTYFWRQALGFCLKKDGTECHVVAGGANCVAAASNDSAPALMTLGATLVFHGTGGQREMPVDQLFTADGIYNKKVKGEILTAIQIPAQHAGHRGAYGKLRDRGTIDFPLLGIAVRLDLDADGTVADADICAVALQARPVRLKKAAARLGGENTTAPGFADVIRACAELASKQCRPLANIPGDPDYRHAMVPVYVRRTLQAALDDTGPVHHL